MKIAFDIVLSLVFIFAGYYAACLYLNNEKLSSKEFNVLQLTKNKILYLVISFMLPAILIVLFQTVYHNEMIAQLKLLSLVLIILPTAAVDFKLQKIPNKFMFAALIVRCVFYIAEFAINYKVAWVTLKDNAIGAIVIGGFFLILLLVFKNSIGMGDVKLFAIIGLYQGLWGGINSVFFSLVASFFISVALLVFRKKKRNDTISFGPSILFGTFVAIALAGI